MNEQPKRSPRSLSRRGFLLGAGVGLAAGVPGGILGWNALKKHGYLPDAKVESTLKTADSRFTMPGLYPGRVVEVHHPRSVSDEHRIDRPTIKEMIDRGMCELTGADHSSEAFKQFFNKEDVIGIKLNPVGRHNNRRDLPESISNKEVVLEIVRNLREIGVPGKNIVLFERYATEFVQAGYTSLLSERGMEGVRWCASAAAYNDQQVAINGIENPDAHSPELLHHVVGYDPDSFVHMGFASDDHSRNDDRRFRSHLSAIVTRMVDKIITIPVLKDHRSAGVTLSLKNMSHGMNNNVARSHLSGIAHGQPDSKAYSIVGPNQCNTFIPAAVNQPLLKQKATLHILDGLIGVYEGGPGNWNKSWGTWRHKSLFFATDPVALDHIGWDIIDAKRLQVGLPRVGEMGKHLFTNERRAAMAMANFAGTNFANAMPLYMSEAFVRGAGDSESFDRRTPEHIILAGLIGLGVYDLKRPEGAPADTPTICYQRIKLG